MIPCDGCGQRMAGGAIKLFMVLGVQVRYCAPCAERWVELETAVNAEVARCQRLADLFALDARARVQLRVTPFDFPRVAVDAHGHPVVLG